jgi:type II secretory pathway pseudopilin PulG
MKHCRKIRTSHRAQSGYALLLIMFMLALLVISMAAAAPTVLSSIQREREKEMVWRGKQYTRGIKLYYLKLNRFPTSLDDLTKPKTGIRFMRQAYKDPMNLVDGSWRLIYVGPNGQLIGSLNQNTIGFGTAGTMGVGGVGGIQGTQGMQGMQGTSGLSSNSASGFGSSFGGSSFGSSFGSGFGSNQNNGLSGNNTNGAMGTALANGTNSSSPNANSTADGSTFDDPTQPHSLAGPMDASNTIGGNIIGVGSKVDKKSFLIYEKAKNYKLFEFIWDPSKDTTAGRASAGIGTPIQGTNGGNGMSPAGTPTSSPFSSGMNPAGMNPAGTQNPGTGQNPATGTGTGTSPDPNQMPPLQAPPNQ